MVGQSLLQSESEAVSVNIRAEIGRVTTVARKLPRSVWTFPPEVAPTAGATEGLGVEDAAGATDGFGVGTGVGEGDGLGEGLGEGEGEKRAYVKGEGEGVGS